MASQQLTLSCNVKLEDNSTEIENLFWKKCTWIRMHDKTVCQQWAVDDYKIDKDNCDSSFGEVKIGLASSEKEEIDKGKERLRCSITFPAKEKDYGEWKCKMHKCKDKKDGGCENENASNCSSEIIVNAMVSNYSFY